MKVFLKQISVFIIIEFQNYTPNCEITHLMYYNSGNYDVAHFEQQT